MKTIGKRIEGSESRSGRVGKRVASTTYRHCTSGGERKSLAKRVRFVESSRREESYCQVVQVFRPGVVSRGDEVSIGGYRLSRISNKFSLFSGQY